MVFVRHALPGERVVVEITEGTDGDRFWRGDAVEVLDASPGPGRRRRARSPDRAAAAAATSSTSRCRASARSRRPWSREQLARLAGLERRRRRSSRCPSSGARRRPALADPDALRGHRRRPARAARAPLARRGPGRGLPDRAPGRPGRRPGGRAGRDETVATPDGTHEFPVGGRRLLAGAPRRRRDAGRDRAGAARRRSRGRGRSTSTPASGCSPGSWPTPSGPAAGWWRSRATGRPPGTPGTTWRRCGMPRSSAARSTGCSPRRTTSPSTWSCSTRRARVPAGRWSSRSSTARPRAVAYVACDPAALARDVAIFAEHGYRLTALRAFDLFPMTHHVECVAHCSRKAALTCGDVIWALGRESRERALRLTLGSL